MLHTLATTTNNSSAAMVSAGKRPVDLSAATSDTIKRRRSNLSPDQDPQPDDTPPENDPDSDAAGLRLLGLLLQCAECVATDNLDDASQLLPEIAELSTPFGSSAQRVGRVLCRRPLGASHHLLPRRVLSLAAPLCKPRHQKLLSALQTYNSVAPLIKFSHFTANQAIQQALDGADHVHVIDLDIMQGLQWPGLFHILASKPRKIKSFTITGLGPSADLLNSTGRRLAEFAAALDIPFQFHSLEGKIGNLKDLNQLNIRLGETVIVHWMHHCLYDITGSDLGALRLLTLIKPKLITIVEQDLSHGGSFLGRFVEALHYYSALFDALGDGLGFESIERHTVEQQVFGGEIRNIVAVGGPKRTGEVNLERWGEEMGRAGFRPVSLAGNPAAQASLLLGMFPWQGYSLVEENGCLKLGWKDLSLLTASAWQPAD
ncbi:scarecrow-like protein 23 [Phtheirospermum japonicum]|uniref:Scarecrow-like protein 23 n=1 Tax=Phtheirospermum japonicum TaxID=374723 RepID=A0A830CBU0_9LAMI|nr:scarecrow-like protein 23 [Phtheirospermum japonicum]